MVKSDVEMPSKKVRQIQHNQCRSETKKRKVKEDHFFDSYESFMNSNLPKEYHSSQESPYLLITRSFHLIEENCIILNKSIITDEGRRSRKVSYSLEKFRSNIVYDECKKYINLRLEKMKINVIFIVIHQTCLQGNKKITLITETGNPEQLSNLRDNL